jgi:hypothetical protein
MYLETYEYFNTIHRCCHQSNCIFGHDSLVVALVV